MEHYRFHKAYILKTRAEWISYTVEFFPRKFSIPKMPSIDDDICAAQNVIHVLKNTAPDIPLVALGNPHKEALISPEKILKINLPSKTSEGGRDITVPTYQRKAYNHPCSTSGG